MEKLLKKALEALEQTLPLVECDTSEGAHPAWRTMHELHAAIENK